MSIITVENLTKIYPVAVKQPGWKGTIEHFLHRTYKDVKAVRDVSFNIQEGEIVGFLGPNGAGKTTTLKMLSGLIYPSRGSINVVGYVPFRRQRGFLEKISLVMGQKQQLLWDIPALDSLRVNGAVYNIPKKIFEERLEELTALLDLGDKLTRPVRKLSLGERMKAELLAALIHHPRVLFLDEPTLGLDVNAQVGVRDFLLEYNRRYRATILLTSHYMADITALCKRVMLIHQGQLMYDGGLEDLSDKFAPCREVRVEFVEPVKREFLEPFGEVQAIEGQEARFLVPRDKLTATVSEILGRWEVIDLSVSEPPIEDVIGRLFALGSVG